MHLILLNIYPILGTITFHSIIWNDDVQEAGYLMFCFFHELLILIVKLLHVFEITFQLIVFVLFQSHIWENKSKFRKKLWHFEMYTVANDFEWRPITPYILHPFDVAYRTWQYCRKSKKSSVWVYFFKKIIVCQYVIYCFMFCILWRLRKIDPLDTEM